MSIKKTLTVIGTAVSTLFLNVSIAAASAIGTSTSASLNTLATSAQNVGTGVTKAAMGVAMGVAAIGGISTYVKYQMNQDHATAKKEAVGMIIGTGALSLGLGYITQKMTAAGAVVGIVKHSAKLIAALHGMHFVS